MFISNSADETVAEGWKFGRNAMRGEVFALIGDLGSGKTQFVKGFVRGIESKVEVTSPTFVLLHEYEGGRLPVYHFDFYRLENRDAALAIGLDEYLFGDGVVLIEWADRYPDLIPPKAKWLAFEIRGENVRTITHAGSR